MSRGAGAAAAEAWGEAVFIVGAVEEGAGAECAAAAAVAGSGGAWKTALTMVNSFAVIGVEGPALRP
ncbi:hypothetical protein AVXHC19_31630 [Acidovorax sacchari]